jgi:hypothetical protein
MPLYNFLCINNHLQELRMTFAEHKELSEDAQGPFIECNVRYGDLAHPICGEKSHQIISSVNFSVPFGEEGRN